MPSKELDELYIKRALSLAAHGAGWTAPNPMVGCVIVNGGRIIGEGYHKRFGEPHAEVVAFENCKESPEGAVVYVTLEPCSHHGKTPPCADRLIEEKVARVVIGSKDVNPEAGGGADRLEAAGIEVVRGVLAEDCAELNAAFYKRLATGLPLLTAKWAMTADGRISTSNGDSKWVSSPQSRRLVHILRGTHRALLIGSGTLKTDDPLMNCRISKLPQPLRVFADSRLAISPEARAFKAEPGGRIIIACLEKYAQAEKVVALEAAGASVILQDSMKDAEHIDLRRLLETLATDYDVDSVMCEAGGKLQGSLFDEGLVDRVEVFISPKICGGLSKGPVEGAGVERMVDARPLRKLTVRSTGGDLHFSAKVGNWEWLKPAMW